MCQSKDGVQSCTILSADREHTKSKKEIAGLRRTDNYKIRRNQTRLSRAKKPSRAKAKQGVYPAVAELNKSLTKYKKPHDQFFDKQTSKEAIMGLRVDCTLSVGKGKRYSFGFKKKTVRAVDEYGIKPVVRCFKVSRNTVREWFRRYQKDGDSGLLDRRKGPDHIPHKTSAKVEQQVIELRQMVPCYGPQRLKYFFDVPCSLGAIGRIIRQNGLNRPRRQKTRKRNDLRKIKAERHKAFEHLQMDVKYLTDIPYYVAQMKPHALPGYQYTVRDTKTGMLFLGYSDELSELNARTMIDYILSHFNAAGVNIENVTVQTDNGAEFSGTARSERTASFPKHIESKLGASHRYIRPGNKNAQADVESSHWMIETEFYDLTIHRSRTDFLQNTEAYRLFFNLIRPNFSKGSKVPWQIGHEDWPNSDIASQISLIPTIDLDKIPEPIFHRGQTLLDLAEMVLL